MSKELKVFDDNILLIPYKMKETESGILLSKDMQDKQVISICFVSTWGDKVKNDDLKHEGIPVCIPRRIGKWVYFEGEKYILVNENDILCIFKDYEIEERGNK